MTDAQLWAQWRLWIGVSAVLVLVAAALLIIIAVQARGILAQALRALAAGERIREKTLPIWELQTTNEVAGELLETVESIEAGARTLAEALETHAGAGGER